MPLTMAKSVIDERNWALVSLIATYDAGLSAQQVDRLRNEFGIYLVGSGRMCVAGLNSKNVHQVAEAFAAVM